MALKTLLNTIKGEGYILKPLDQYLLSLNYGEESDRAINVNSPSSISGCMRARFYSRTGAEKDSNSIDARLRRIFDNGTCVHERLQKYLKAQGMLLMDEVPLRNDRYNIQGHTDGLVQITPKEVAILEIKSIKSENLRKLKDADMSHKEQASIYMFCAEERRLYLRSTYKSMLAFTRSKAERIKYYESLYQHLEDGSKYTREEKIGMQVDLNIEADRVMYKIENQIKKVIILYEDKNTQEIKEFCVKWDNDIILPLLERCVEVNNSVKYNDVPKREGTKSSQVCRWCSYKGICHIV